MKKYNLKNDNMNKSELQRVYNYEKYPRDSIITTNRGFVILDNGSLKGTHWICFTINITNPLTTMVSEELLRIFY